VTSREIRRACQERLENFMVPGEIVFLPELPKTDTGKIRKKDLSRSPAWPPEVPDAAKPAFAFDVKELR